jgi:methionyl-tRNA formyltransferase
MASNVTLAAMIRRDLRIIFMGTPSFAIPCLQYLMDAGYPIVGVITAPDKPGGRGMKQMISSPVKQFAEINQLRILQPPNLKSKEFLVTLAELKADLQVVVAFRMLPEAVWNMPSKGTINLHGSLLPAYRGAAPIQWAIIRGEKFTGVTTFLLQHEIDTGNIILQHQIPILDTDNGATLHDRMMHIGARTMLSTVDLLASSTAVTQEQDDSLSSHAPKLTHENTRINWHDSAENIHNLVRGLAPYPAAWTTLDEQELKVLAAQRTGIDSTGSPGQMAVTGKQLLVQTATELIAITELQLTGKKRMKAADFLNGYRIRHWSLT